MSILKEIKGKEYTTTCCLDDLSTSVSDGKYKVRDYKIYYDKNDKLCYDCFETDSSIEVRGGWICYKDLMNTSIEVTYKQGRIHTYIESIEFKDDYFRIGLGT